VNISRIHPSTTTYACPIPGLYLSAVPLRLPRNVDVGIKVWTLISPENSLDLYDPMTGLLHKSFQVKNAQFPTLENLRSVAVTVTQYPGEAIFVPSGWHHQIVNHGYLHAPSPPQLHLPNIFRTNGYSPTLSLNHNWFNAACLTRMYDSLCREYTLSTHAIRDLQQDTRPEDFENLVQNLLRANYGMNWEQWWDLVEWNMKTRSDGEKMEGVTIRDVFWETRNRMDEGEEIGIALQVIHRWLGRDEVHFLSEVKERVLAFQKYLKERQEFMNT
jgi:JmjC domain, hydroxylase